MTVARESISAVPQHRYACHRKSVNVLSDREGHRRILDFQTTSR